MRVGGWLGAATLVALVSCRALVSLDGLDDGPPLAGADAGDTGADSGSPEGSSAEAGIEASIDGVSPANPVVRSGDMNTGTLAVSVAGQYRVEFLESGNWLPTRWFDLAVSPTENLAGTPRLNAPWIINYAGNWRNPEDGNSQYANPGEENDVRVSVTTHYHHDAVADAGYDAAAHFSVQGEYWFYASGRVAASQQVENSFPDPQSLAQSEYGHVDVAPVFSGTGVSLGASSAVAFVKPGPTPSSALLFVGLSGDNTIEQNNPTNRYVRNGPVTIPSAAAVTRLWELQLTDRGASQAELAERVDDVQNPNQQTLEGCTSIGYYEGAYHLTTSANRLRTLLTNTYQRHSPAFVIEGWKSPTWSVKLGADVIASSAQTRTPRGIGVYDSSAQRLVFVYMGAIPRAAADPDRTFTVE